MLRRAGVWRELVDWARRAPRAPGRPVLCRGGVAVLALVLRGHTAENRIGYRRGRFPGANEKIFCGLSMRRSAAIMRVRACAVGRAREYCAELEPARAARRTGVRFWPHGRRRAAGARSLDHDGRHLRRGPGGDLESRGGGQSGAESIVRKASWKARTCASARRARRTRSSSPWRRSRGASLYSICCSAAFRLAASGPGFTACSCLSSSPRS